jgi:exodeoxyribonuclease-3
VSLTFVSWNVDSLNAALTGTSDRAILSQAVLDNLAALAPDIIAIQETKLSAAGPTKAHITGLGALFPDYDLAWRSSGEPARKGYAGTMLLWKKSLPAPIISQPHIGAPPPMDSEGRIITAEFPGFYFTTVYTPNAGDGLTRLPDRGRWDDAYRAYLAHLDAHKPVVACGDYNVAYAEIDLANPASNHQSPGFTDQERDKFGLLLGAGFTDTFRHLHGDVTGRYTWYAQRVRTSKINNSGWRIDYFLVSDRLADAVTRSDMIDTGARQDHVPVLLEVDGLLP